MPNTDHSPVRITRRLVVATGACALASATRVLGQQAYPSRDVKFIVPWAAGGSLDASSRLVAELMHDSQFRIVIENVPGGSSSIGLTRVAQAVADGYTIGLGSSTALAQASLGKGPRTLDSFTCIALLYTEPELLVVSAASPHKTLEGFIASLRARPERLVIATPGVQNINHLYAEMTARVAGIEYVHVPYNNAGRVMADLLGGHVESAVVGPTLSLEFVRSGAARALGLFANERLAIAPDIPTFKEKGFDVFPYGVIEQVVYIVAPRDLPDEIRDRIANQVTKAVQHPRFQEYVRRNGNFVRDLTGEALKKEILDMEAAFGVVMRQVFKSE